jgi:DNA polymerase-3 subunit alpha
VDLRKVGKRALESMIKVGVLDEWGERHQLLEAIDRIIGHSGRTLDAASVGQMSLFGGGPEGKIDIAVELLRPADKLKETDHRDKLAWEKDLIGVYVSEHPLDRYIEIIQTQVTATAADLDQSFHGRGATILGLLTSLRPYVTKKGSSMAFGVMEDLSGSFELIFFPRTWKEYHAELHADRVYMVRGEVRVESDDRVKIIVDTITDNLSMALPMELEDQARKSNQQPRIEDSLPEIETREIPNSREVSPEELSDLVPNRPPPPPNFVEINQEIRHEASGVEDKDQPEQREAKSQNAQETIARKAMVVEVKASKNWQSICRKIVKLMDGYEGQDTLSIKISGKPLQMDFPNLGTEVCPELIAKLEKISNVKKVEVSELTDSGSNGQA